MNIIIISTPSEENAGNVVYKLLKTLKEGGHNATIISKYGSSSQDTVNLKFNKYFIKIKNKIFDIALPRKNEYCFFDIKETGKTRYLQKALRKINIHPDIIFIAFHQNFLSSRDILELSKAFNSRIIYWMMDMVEFTGGCHYALNCMNYIQNCDNCPAFKKGNVKFAKNNLLSKKKYFEELKPIFISISDTQKKQAKKSSNLKNLEVVNIYHSINLELFYPSQTKYRQNNSFKILFCASRVNEIRKGFIHLLEALRFIEESHMDDLCINKLEVLVIGKISNDLLKKHSNSLKLFDLKFLGSINDQIVLAEKYRSADILVCPTLADSGPLTIMEAMASGLPIVSYNQGVASDLVSKYNFGELINTGNIIEFGLGILRAINYDSIEYSLKSRNARETAESLFNNTKFSKEVLSLISTID